ncbi:MAG: hypothetical protein NTX50_23925 [Candidatus Sumerlaeota bacterium]|nr:hypothetical protein [Candidatus Sumerlaeota bacterium]
MERSQSYAGPRPADGLGTHIQNYNLINYHKLSCMKSRFMRIGEAPAFGVRWLAAFFLRQDHCDAKKKAASHLTPEAGAVSDCIAFIPREKYATEFMTQSTWAARYNPMRNFQPCREGKSKPILKDHLCI